MEHNKRKAALMLVLVLVLSALMQSTALAEALRVGSRGEAVEQLQTKLKRWGYYTGTVDGIFGAQTKAAVEYFQRRNGLAVDGIVGDETAKALGLTLSGSTNAGNSEGSGSSSDASGNLYLLARLVYGEARGEPYKGQVAGGAQPGQIQRISQQHQRRDLSKRRIFRGKRWADQPFTRRNGD